MYADEPAWFDYDYSDFRPVNSTYYTAYATAIMNVNRHDTIHLHSSLMSNIWEKDGRRSDKVAVIPMVTALD